MKIVDSRIQKRAVEYGAMDVEPYVQVNGVLEWPADTNVVSLTSISYSPDHDEFAGWSLGNVPEWVQR